MHVSIYPRESSASAATNPQRCPELRNNFAPPGEGISAQSQIRIGPPRIPLRVTYLERSRGGPDPS
jgi:hypothetical protein